MREIKFRAWNKKEKLMVDLVKITTLALSIDPSLAGGKIGIYIPDHPDLEIMQFIGLKDNNGKEIYEGDIVIANRFDNEEWQYTIKNIRDIPYQLTSSNTNYIEIIGNKFENPELLK